MEMQQAVRAYKKLVAPKYEAQQYAEMCDRAVDGGEWSGGGYQDVYDEIEYNALLLVSIKFGVRMRDLDNAVNDSMYREEECFMRAIGVLGNEAWMEAQQ